MNPQLANMPRVLQADVLPAAPGIGRLVHAVAVRDINADGGFAHAGVDDVGIGFRHRQRPDRRRLEIAVGDVLPILSGVFGLPDAASAGAKVECAQLGGVAGDGDHPSAAEGSDAAPVSDIVEGKVHCVCAFFGGGCKMACIVAGRYSIKPHFCIFLDISSTSGTMRATRFFLVTLIDEA